MNLMLNGRDLSLVSIPYDGQGVSPAGLKPIARFSPDARMSYDGRGMALLSDTIVGGGHPSLHPNRRHIVTDAYVGEKCAFGDGTVPIRWIDLTNGTESVLARIQSLPPFTGPFNAMRVDPHPAWDRTYTKIVFNACPTGTRQVFIADMADLV